MPDETERRYLFVAIDRASRWVYLRIYKNQSEASSVDFLRRLEHAAPIKISKILTDNGSQFTDRFTSKNKVSTGQHAFDRACTEYDVEHRLIPPRHPQTNGMVERFNGRISEVLQQTRFASAAELETTLMQYCKVYNYAIPQRALNHKTPIESLKQWQQNRPALFTKRVYNLTGLDKLLVWDGCMPMSAPPTSWRLCLADGTGGYKALFRQGIRELGCWAHARRKFFALHAANQSPMAAEALERIGKLYTIEQQAEGMTPEQRQAVRQSESVPLLQSLHDWLHHRRLSLAQGSSSAKAIDYTLRRWEALIRYAQTGDLPIDNNPVENAIRPIALGKKNWLFAGSERAGRRAAAIQSLLGTAKLNGLDPLAWLKDTLEKLPIWPNRRIDELLPFKR